MGNNDQYKYRLYSTSLYYPATPQFISGDDFPNTGGFASLYYFTEATREALVAAGTAKGFKGVVWSPFLQLDFDTYEDGYRAETKLKEMGYAFDVYDTGGRGLHLSVNRTCSASHVVPGVDRQFVGEHFPEADLSIYTHLHLFRLPGTIHSSGKIKRFLRDHRGQALSLRGYVSTDIESEKTTFYQTQEGARSVFECFRVMSNSTPVTEGERHHTLVKLTYALKDDAAVDRFAALWWLSQVNKLYVDRKSEEDLEKIVGSIYE